MEQGICAAKIDRSGINPPQSAILDKWLLLFQFYPIHTSNPYFPITGN
jgi:hypothetical protein